MGTESKNNRRNRDGKLGGFRGGQVGKSGETGQVEQAGDVGEADTKCSAGRRTNCENSRGNISEGSGTLAVHPFVCRAFTFFCCTVIVAGVVLSAAVMIAGLHGQNGSYSAQGDSPRGRTASVGDENSEASAESVRTALSEAERTLMYRFICAECRGEPFLCKVAAAAVIFNRIDSDFYPSSAADVIFDAGAFYSVSEGTVALEHSDSEMRSAMRAVRLAERGEDPTKGAVCLGHINGDFKGALPSEVTLTAGDMVFGNP